nr:hypothetical protein CFP56_55809 [Quercus suber]
MRKPFYCRYHQYVSHGTRDCRAIRRTFHKKISDGTLNLTREQEVQRNPLPQHHIGKATTAVLFNNGADEDEMASSTSMPSAAISVLQRSPTFRILFNQLGLKEELRRTASEALVSIVASFGTHCLTAEAHASQAFLETTNAITFTNEDMEVKHPDHSRLLYIATQINDVHIRNALVDTGASLNLIPTNTLKAAGIPLSRIAGVPIEVFGFVGIHECTIRSIHKPICIPANPTPFDLSEAHYFEATFYDELAPSGEDSTSRHVGILLPDWQDIENNLEIGLSLIKGKRKENVGKPLAVSHSHDVYKSNYQMVVWDIVYDSMRGLAVLSRKVSD